MSTENRAAVVQALASDRKGFMSQGIGYFLASRKWWLLPILIVMMLLGALLLMSGTVAAPFIYTLF